MALTLALSLLGNLVVALFILVCAALILIILLQKGRGGGLGAAFGGGGAGSLLGTKTGDFLTWVTITLVAGFLVLAVLMGKFMRGSEVSSELSGGLTAPAPETVAVDDVVTGAEGAAEEGAAAAAEVVDESADVMDETVEVVEEAVEDVEDQTEAETTE